MSSDLAIEIFAVVSGLLYLYRGEAARLAMACGVHHFGGVRLCLFRC